MMSDNNRDRLSTRITMDENKILATKQVDMSVYWVYTIMKPIYTHIWNLVELIQFDRQ